VVECERRYSYKEAADVAGLSLTYIKRACAAAQQSGGHDGIWPLEILPGRVLIPATSLDKWLQRFRTA